MDFKNFKMEVFKSKEKLLYEILCIFDLYYVTPLDGSEPAQRLAKLERILTAFMYIITKGDKSKPFLVESDLEEFILLLEDEFSSSEIHIFLEQDHLIDQKRFKETRLCIVLVTR